VYFVRIIKTVVATDCFKHIQPHRALLVSEVTGLHFDFLVSATTG